MNVVLVNPPQPGLVDPYTYPPVGLAYIAAAVRKWRPGDKVILANLAGHGTGAAAGHIVSHRPHVVGYTATTTYWLEACQLARRVREMLPKVKQVVGGPHPTLTGQTAECFDAIVIGPGERTFITFLNDLATPPYKHRMLYGPAEALTNARSFPAPADVLGGCLHASSQERTAVVFSSFGCTNNCAFCAARGMYRKIEMRSVESVAAEVEGILAYGVKDVRFMDDTFGIDADRAERLCKRLDGLGLRWGCVMRVDQATPRLLAAMKKGGCVEVGLGIESFDQDVLDGIRKRVTVAQNVAAVEAAHDAGLDVHLFLMISTPGETAGETVRLNVRALERLRTRFTRLLLSTLMPYPGSAIYRAPHRFGALLLEPDATMYNQHQYQGRNAEEAEVWSPLIFEGMTREEQLANIREMRTYAGSLRQVNRGRFERAS